MLNKVVDMKSDMFCDMMLQADINTNMTTDSSGFYGISGV